MAPSLKIGANSLVRCYADFQLGDHVVVSQRMAEFEIKIATDAQEIIEAQRLRFQVFNLELTKGLQSSYQSGLDVDEFDPFCNHLIVRDTQSKEIVGTYRMMLGAQARQHL